MSENELKTVTPTAPKLRQFLRGGLMALLVAVTLVAGSSEAYAQKKKKDKEAPTKSYVFAYTITMMMVSLGLMTVCRPGKRKDRPDEIKEDLSQ
jgi:hypothetical protein